MLSSKQKLRVVSKATISTSEDDSSDNEVKKRISGQLVYLVQYYNKFKIKLIFYFSNLKIKNVSK